MTVFKYLSPESASEALSMPGFVKLRFNFPKDYNDPFELFLEPDQPLEEVEIALYEHLIGELPQLPVTCFSRIPDSVPLWAHYGKEHTGVCIGFDEERLTDHFPIAIVDDVRYAESSAEVRASAVKIALATKKRRHSEQLISEACRVAYFVKREAWRYENERRLVVDRGDVEEKNGLLLAEVSLAAVRYILIGQQASSETVATCRRLASKYDIPIYSVRYGKRFYAPYFVPLENGSAVCWIEDEFQDVGELCGSCGEPLPLVDDKCARCSLSQEAWSEATHNQLTLLLSIGHQMVRSIAFDRATTR